MANQIDDSVKRKDRKRTGNTHREVPLGSSESSKAESENSIRPSRRKAQNRTAEPAPSAKNRGEKAADPRTATSSAKGKPKPARRVVPEHIHRRFVAVGHRYYFADGAHAFTDRGSRLTTPSENTEVIKSLIAIAEARGWTEITVSGTERFRRDAWLAASVAGLSVRGYRPTEFERAQLARTIARDRAREEPSREPTATKSEPSGREPSRPEAAPAKDRFVVGRLVDHGPAPYRHDPHERMSYFVRLETPAGAREIWGVDLQRALNESLTNPKKGDEVGLRALRRESVKVQVAERDEAGTVIREAPLETHRNRWILEKREFFAERAAAARMVRDATVDPKDGARRHPELVGTYLQMRAAELAAKQFRDPQDRRTFVSRIRTALADAIARGEPLQPVRLKDRAPPAKAAPVPADPVR